MTEVRLDADTRAALAGCGERLRSARQAAGLSPEDVSSRLKMQLRVVRALEAEDWERLGAPVYVRGQMRSYARLLGILDEPAMAALSSALPVRPTEVVSKTHIPASQWWVDQIGRRLAYVALTAALAIPVWIAAQSHLKGVPDVAQSLDAPVALPQGDAATPVASQSPARRTVVASMAAVAPAAPVAQAQAELLLRTRGESWIEIRGTDGKILEQGLLDAGQERRWPLSQVASAKLGNASALELHNAGQPVTLAEFSRGEVARFTVSSDGSLAPVP